MDVRIHDERIDGEPVGTLNLREMEPEQPKFADFSFVFGFENLEGDEEQWRLIYGAPPWGGDPVSLPVEVVGHDYVGGDNLSDSWTITGTSAGLGKIGGETGFQTISMPFVWELTLQ